ncbi:MAG: S41 family peptidase [Planctomycetota bacterium]|jgi:hypothetical protein
MTGISRRLLILLPLLLLARPAAGGKNLAKAYPGKLGWSRSGLFPVCTAEDVWNLKKFELAFGRDFKVSCKDATVAFGVHEGNVLWAAVFPQEPAKIQAEGKGNGESARTVFLRFPPAELNRIFPPATVRKRGDAWLRAEAVRIAQSKICWKWCTPAGNPTIVQGGWRLVDVDTVEGGRRFYGVDTSGGKVEYVAEFENAPVPASPPITKREARAAFDEVWTAFDKEYACFGLRPKVNWAKLGETYRRDLDRVDTVFRAAAVIADMLAHLENLHVWVKAGNDGLPGYTRPRPLNASWEAVPKILGPVRKAGDNLQWGRKDRVGYLNVHGLSDPKLPEHVDAALESLKDTKTLIVDLRFNGGGDELLARQVAGRFVDEERVYSLNQYRSGPSHNELGEKLERAFAPRGPWRYENPVVVLWGRKTLSSAESMALMFAQCPQVTTMGDPSGGSSANPRRLELKCGITVNLPRWLDMDPKGNPIEHVGVKPEKLIKAKPEDFTAEKDPVLKAALKYLRKKR